MNKVCFVISPIGEEGSAVRAEADDLFDIVVSPVLKAHGFDVVRADKIPGSGAISDEIVTLIQTATLCIIDLTGHNANVYYECGRRHETGKPFIQLMKKGDKLPFDLAGIRTIFYELATARSAHAASEELEKFVGEFERGGFANESSGASLGALAATIDRIDRKLDALRDGAFDASKAFTRSAGLGGLQALLASPRKALDDAIRAGDLEAIRALFPRIRRLGVDHPSFSLAANILAANGDEDGLVGLEQILDTASLKELWTVATGGVVRYAQLRGEAKEIWQRFEQRFRSIIDDAQTLEDPADRAFVANQAGILSDSAELPQVSATFTRRAIDLRPSEMAYKVNLAIALEKFDLDDAARVVDSYMSAPEAASSRFALEEAVDVYVAANRIDDARNAIATLERIDPVSAGARRLQYGDELGSG